MPLYLLRFSYTTESVKAMLANPHDRAKAASEAAETLGAKLQGFWWALGEFDGVALVEAPDNMTAGALSILVGGSGALSRLETTALLTIDEAQEALTKAAGASYRPPSG